VEAPAVFPRHLRTHARVALTLGLLLLIPLLVPLAGSTPARADLPDGFREYVVLSGLHEPTAVEFARNGQIVIAEKSGTLKIFDSFSDQEPAVYDDLRDTVHNFWDRGLLGLALDPAFPTDPSVYVLYTFNAAIGGTAPGWQPESADGTDPCPDPPGPTSDGCVVGGRLAKVQIQGDSVREQVLVEDWCQQYPSHSIGDLAFGADGALYVSGGDGASYNWVDYGQDGDPVNPCGDPPGGAVHPPGAEGGALRSQDARTTGDPTGLDGAILRVDPDTGGALRSNPMASAPDPNARRIVAYGLRNPFRFAVRPGTSELWIGDVGWNTWEEVNRTVGNDRKVDNFGWPCYEGDARHGGYDNADLTVCERLYGETAAHTRPVLAYEHSGDPVTGCSAGGGSSVSGIAFYPETGSLPATYRGALLLADYARNCIYAVPKGAGGQPDPARRSVLAGAAAAPVDLEIGPRGDLFYVDLLGGTLRRIAYSDGNQPPVAAVTAAPARGDPPLTVRLDGGGSSDPDPGDPLSFAWDLDGDGQFDDSTDRAPSWTYTGEGRRAAAVEVTDGFGGKDTATATIGVGDTAPVPVIRQPAEPASFAAGRKVTFQGAASEPHGGDLPPSALSWKVGLAHCAGGACHSHGPLHTARGAAGGSFTMPDHEPDAHIELELTATSGGESTTVTRRIGYTGADLTLASRPGGIPLTLGGRTNAAPFASAQHAGGTVSVGAPETAVVAGRTYRFVAWSDGGARTHDLTVPDGTATYTAEFRPLGAGESRSRPDGATGAAGPAPAGQALPPGTAGPGAPAAGTVPRPGGQLPVVAVGRLTGCC
jgi:glucose/arabinose dehydrogenase